MKADDFSVGILIELVNAVVAEDELVAAFEVDDAELARDQARVPNFCDNDVAFLETKSPHDFTGPSAFQLAQELAHA